MTSVARGDVAILQEGRAEVTRNKQHGYKQESGWGWGGVREGWIGVGERRGEMGDGGRIVAER